MLSVCLPGLGQLYQRRLAFTALAFGGFCALSLCGVTRPFLPVWALLAGLEALRHPAAESAEDRAHRQRRLIFALFGVAGGCAWLLMLMGAWFPSPHTR